MRSWEPGECIMDTIEKALRKKEFTLNGQIDDRRSINNDRRSVDRPVDIVKETTEAAANTELSEYTDEQFLKNGVLKIEQQHFPSKSVSSKTVEIDTEYLINQGFLTPNDVKSEISEEFRQIKRPLLNNIRGKSAHPIKKANLIQVTSSLQGEGKTFNAINLAMAIAMEMDFKVLLVDADVIKPSIAKELNLVTDKGLVEYLSGEVTQLSEIMLNTNISKLTILPAGNQHNLTTELVSSDVMEHLFTELSERYSDRVVIIDSPPILQTNESIIISQKVGQIVFVVEQNSTAQSDVENAISKLDPNAVIGVVMNKSRSGETGSYYGYGAE